MESKKAYLEVEGVDALREALTKLRDQVGQGQHFVLYKLGEQRVMIRMDLNQKPTQFYYQDFNNRPATPNIKEVISSFYDKPVDLQRVFINAKESVLRQLVTASQFGDAIDAPNATPEESVAFLKSLSAPAPVAAARSFGLFAKKPVVQEAPKSEQSFTNQLDKPTPNKSGR